MSSAIVSLNDPWATSWGLPIASKTWLGSSDPDVHAEPEDAAIPLASNNKSNDSPSIPSKQKFTLPGNLFSLAPFKTECSIFESPSISLSLKVVTFALDFSILDTASF